MVIWDAHEFNSRDSGRCTLFIVFISGSVFFYIYGGFLTSSLAIPNENLPFKSPKELLKTNYRLQFKKNNTEHAVQSYAAGQSYAVINS